MVSHYLSVNLYTQIHKEKVSQALTFSVVFQYSNCWSVLFSFLLMNNIKSSMDKHVTVNDLILLAVLAAVIKTLAEDDTVSIDFRE